MNFPNGLLYCCLAEAYAFLKGPMDMLQLYEGKYQVKIGTGRFQVSILNYYNQYDI